MRWILLLAAAVTLAPGCATATQAAEEAAELEPAVEDVAPGTEAPESKYRKLRLGFWEIDLIALDREPRGTTLRLLDLKILRLLEVGFGEDYYSVSLVESPELLNVFTSRREGPSYEHRLLDLQALALAVGRATSESDDESSMNLLKMPILGSAYGHETEPVEERWNVLYVFRHHLER
jgi:hypothetical protein